MIQETFDFLLLCAFRLLYIAQNTIVVDLTLPIHGNHYQMSLLTVCITFAIFDLAAVVISIPIRKALNDSFKDD